MLKLTIVGFWLTHKSFYEQPNIKLKGKYMLVAITNNLRYPIICSNYKYLQQFSNFDKCSLIKVPIKLFELPILMLFNF